MTELDTADGIARYTIDLPNGQIDPSADGEWVLYEDHIAALRSAHEAGKREGIGVLREARGRFNVEYADDGRVLSVSHAGGALRSLVAHLDAAILSLSPSPTGAQVVVGSLVTVPGLAYGPEVVFRVLGVNGERLWLKDEARGWSYVEGAKNVLPAPPADGEGSR